MIDPQTITLFGLTFTTGWSLMELRKKQNTQQAREWLDASEKNAADTRERDRKYVEAIVGDHKSCTACGMVYGKRAMQEVEHWIEDPYDRSLADYSSPLLRRRLVNAVRSRNWSRTEWFCRKHAKPFTIQLQTLGRYSYRFNADGSLWTGPGPRYFNRVPRKAQPEWEEYIPKEPTK